ncbi:MAG: 1,4-dihydroxy-6-naphthoate synthase [Rikenellaceae bacterium]
MSLSLHISPCPNDTFIFHALFSGLIDHSLGQFTFHFEDISQLNQRALEGEADIIKVSAAMIPALYDKYYLLPCGGAMGYGNGPLLVSRHKAYAEEVADLRIAVPGLSTTATLLLQRLFPKPKELREYLFSDIAMVVMDGEMDGGVLIHEGRFTYADTGLSLIADLGERWEQTTGLPIPLGVIMVSRSLPKEVAKEISRAICESIRYAMQNPKDSAEFVRSHAQELEQSVMERHISYFVNDFSMDMSKKGIEAIRMLVDCEDISPLR